MLQKIIRREVDHERCCRISPGARWIMRGSAENHQERDGSCEVLQKIIRSELDHERCCRRSSGAIWIMRMH